jgi:uncharacterized membrane protein
MLPAISVIVEPSRRLELFEAIEHRFSAQVKVSVPLAGLSGAYMVERLGMWDRFVTPDGWWLAAMAIVWLAFMAILFVIEPFALRRWFDRRAMADPAGTFRLVQRAHWALLAAGTVTAAAGVLGAHGFLG